MSRRPAELSAVVCRAVAICAVALFPLSAASTAGAQEVDPAQDVQPPPEEAYGTPPPAGAAPWAVPVAPPGYGTPSAPAPSATPAPVPPPGERYVPYGNPPPTDDDACWDSRDLEDDADRDPDALPADRCLRSTVEMVELYIYGASLGIGTAALGIAEMGIKDGGIRFMLAALGATAGIVGAYGLDELTVLEPGMPMAISSGVLLGFFEGFLTHAAFAGEPFAEKSGRAMLGGMALGAGLGTLAAYTLRPTPGDNSLLRSGAMWGAWYGLMTNLIVNEDDDETVMRVLFTGYNVGMLGAAILTNVAPMSRLRVLYLDAGGLVGALAGGLFLTPIAGSDPDPSAFGWGLGFSSLAGMILTYVLTVPDDAEPLYGGEPSDDSALDDFSLFGVPLPGGMVVGAGSRF